MSIIRLNNVRYLQLKYEQPARAKHLVYQSVQYVFNGVKSIHASLKGIMSLDKYQLMYYVLRGLRLF